MRRRVLIYLAAVLWVLAAVQVWGNFRLKNQESQQAFHSSEYRERAADVKY